MPDREITPENPPYQREVFRESLDSSSDEETVRSNTSWNREELNHILFVIIPFINLSRKSNLCQ